MAEAKAALERVTITLTRDLAEEVRSAVARGEFASTSEVVREALRRWSRGEAVHDAARAELRALIAEGLQDIAEGRTRAFDAESVIAEGEARLARRGRSE